MHVDDIRAFCFAMAKHILTKPVSGREMSIVTRVRHTDRQTEKGREREDRQTDREEETDRQRGGGGRLGDTCM